MIELDELPGVIVQADKILALPWTTDFAVSTQWKDQAAFAQRSQHGLVEDASKRRGDGPVLRREPAGWVKDP